MRFLIPVLVLTFLVALGSPASAGDRMVGALEGLGLLGDRSVDSIFLLDVIGRKSGESRPVMLMLAWRGDDLLVTGSRGGHPETPNWYKNLMAAGEAEVQVGADTWSVTARELPEGAEREECWRLLVEAYPDFASYQELTDRRLPVAVLSRVAD